MALSYLSFSVQSAPLQSASGRDQPQQLAPTPAQHAGGAAQGYARSGAARTAQCARKRAPRGPAPVPLAQGAPPPSPSWAAQPPLAASLMQGIGPAMPTAATSHRLAAGVRPTGLGARDTLRLEVCFHLYGNDLSEDRNPIEAGLGWCCKLDTDFVGAEALRRVEPDQTLVPFAFTGPGIPRQDNPVNAPHGHGVVTSGSLSPCLEIGIGMAYVPVADAQPGTAIEIDVRGKLRSAEVRERPLYQREESSG